MDSPLYTWVRSLTIFLVGNQVQIEYRDHEGVFVTMTNNSDLQDALRCLAPLPNTDNTFRMVIKMDKSTTPAAFEHIRLKRAPRKRNFTLHM